MANSNACSERSQSSTANGSAKTREIPWRHSDGSVPLTLIAAIVLGGLVVALFTIVYSGVQSSARDRDFAQAIQIADSGLQGASVYVERLIQEDVVPGDIPGDVDPEDEAQYECVQPGWWDGGDNTADSGACVTDWDAEGQTDWSYERVGDNAYRVESVGRFRTSARSVQVTMSQEVDQTIGMIGIDTVEFAGGGGGDGEPFVIGTYGCIFIPASLFNNESFEGFLYLGDDEEVDRDCWTPPGRTGPVSEGGAYLGRANRELATVKQTIDAECEDPEDPEDSFDSGLSEAANRAGAGDDPFICVRQAHFPQGFDLQEYITDDLLASGGTLTIYVRPQTGDVASDVVLAGRFGSDRYAETVNAGEDPGNLNMVIDAGTVRLGQFHDVSMNIDAPNSLCYSATQGTYNGTITCKDIDLRGGYNYVPPEEGQERFVVRVFDWTEERVPEDRRALSIP